MHNGELDGSAEGRAQQIDAADSLQSRLIMALGLPDTKVMRD